MSSPRGVRTLFAVLVFATLFGGEAIRNAVSWYGFAAWAGLLAVVSVVVLVRVRGRRPAPAALPSSPEARRAAPTPPRHRSRASWWRLPAEPIVWLAAFVLWCVASLAWSEYPLGTLLGVVAILATTAGVLAAHRVLGRAALVRALAIALGALLAGSLAFEVVVGVLGRPVLPVFPIDVPADPDDIPDAFYWSRAELFEGGRIQGLPGNSNLLGFVALLAVVVSASAGRRGVLPRWAGIAGTALGLVVLLLTRSSTVLVAAVAVAVAAFLAFAFRPTPTGRSGWRIVAGWSLVGAVLLGAIAAPVAAPALILSLGKSPDLTGRLDIWASVLDLAAQRPVAGWGWVSYWQPWIPFFDGLAVRNGVEYLQAHNAFLDVLLQLGAIGLVFFAGLLLTVLARAIRAARTTALPLLLFTALLVQALAESRLLYEGNWGILVLLALGAFGDAQRPLGAAREAEDPPNGDLRVLQMED